MRQAAAELFASVIMTLSFKRIHCLCIKTVNNIVALWRLGARNILELPLLAASSKMETAPMAGKT